MIFLRWSALGVLAAMIVAVSGCGKSTSVPPPNPTPVITALYPSSITAGSQSFTVFIAGNGFISGSAGTSTAYWNGSPRTSSVNLNTGQIAITVLASDVATPGTAQVTVSNPVPGGGISQNAAPFQIYAALPNSPLISSISPATASPKGAAFTLTVSGSNFISASTVAWNNSPRATTFVSATQLTAQVSDTDLILPGCDNVSVYTPSGGGNFNYSPAVSFNVSSASAPVICSISPVSVVAGAPAFTLSVNGASFASGATLNWNGKPRTTTVRSANSLQAQISATDVATAGSETVTVVNSGSAGGSSAAVNFVVSPTPPTTPTITSLSPTSATAGGAAFTLTVTGSNFVPASVVDWNGGARNTTYKSSTSLQAAIQLQDIATAGTAQVTVVTFGANGGIVSSAPVNFTITAASTSAAAKFPQVVSLSAAGGPADGPSEAPAISADGRNVAFYSQAKNLVAQGVTGNVFVRDTCVGALNCTPKTMGVDLAPDGSGPNGKTGRQVAMSGDGRFVGFISRATNLISGSAPTPGYWELYVRDLCTGINAPAGCIPHTEMISLGADGDAANAPSASPSINGDGRYVAFVSAGTNLVTEPPVLRPQVYIRDTCAGPTGTKACVPRTITVATEELDRAAGAQAGRPTISADGRYVSFEIWSAQSSAQSRPSTSEIVLADTCLGIEAPAVCAPSTKTISYAPDGSTLSGANISPSISGDGRFVVFEWQPADAATGNTSSSRALLRDACLGPTAPDGCIPSTTLLPTEANSATAKAQSFSPMISASGRYISSVSGSLSSAPANEDSNEGSLVIRDTCFGAILPCTPHTYGISGPSLTVMGAHTASANLSHTASGTKMAPLIADKYSAAPISADGHFAAFYAPDTADAQPASGVGDVYLTVTPF
ncbi:MAG: IPT/TIG domain-containing protein [Candidatus Acidiferrales bacterium]